MINSLRAANLCQKIHRKLKPAVAVAALLAGSVFAGNAQAEIVQLNVSGDTFSGYLFFDTSYAPTDQLGNGKLYYFGYSYISTPLFTGTTFPYTTNPINPYTGSPVANDASSPYVSGGAFLVADPTKVLGGSWSYYDLVVSNRDGTVGYFDVLIKQSSNSNLLLDASFAGANVLFTLNDNWFEYNQILSGTGTISLPAVTPPVSAVPEPASWALALAGLGVVGVTAARRRKAGREDAVVA